MSNLFTLDSIREEADKQFAPVKIGLSDGTEVTLRNLLRLKSDDRAVVREQIKVFTEQSDDDNEDDRDALSAVDATAAAATEILSRVADKPRELLEELDGDVGMLVQVVQTWMSGTQSGEAQPSPA